jgi:hypothetical protein
MINTAIFNSSPNIIPLIRYCFYYEFRPNVIDKDDVNKADTCDPLVPQLPGNAAEFIEKRIATAINTNIKTHFWSRLSYAIFLHFALPDSGDQRGALFPKHKAEAIMREMRSLLNKAIAALLPKVMPKFILIAREQAFSQLRIEALDEKKTVVDHDGRETETFVYHQLRDFLSKQTNEWDEKPFQSNSEPCKQRWNSFWRWLECLLPGQFFYAKKRPVVAEGDDDDAVAANDDDDDEGDTPSVLQYTLRARPGFFLAAMWRLNEERTQCSTDEHPQKLFCVMPDAGGFIIGSNLHVDAKTLERLLTKKQNVKHGRALNSLEQALEKCDDPFIREIARKGNGIAEALESWRESDKNLVEKVKGIGARADLPALTMKANLLAIIFPNLTYILGNRAKREKVFAVGELFD